MEAQMGSDTAIRGKDCKVLSAEGVVELESRYVRITLLDLTLDEAAKTWTSDEGTVVASPQRRGTARIGIPLWRASAAAVNATRPRIQPTDAGPVAIGTDLVFLPGHGGQPPKPIPVKRVPMHILGDRAKVRSRTGLALNDTQLRSLARDGQIVMPDKGGAATLVRVRQTGGAMAAKRDVSQLALSSGAAIHQLQFMINEAFDGSPEAAIRAFLADPRARSWHNPDFAPVAFITAIKSDLFDQYLALLQELPQWKSVVSVTTTPPLPSFPIGIVTVYRQIETLLGFQRGRLVESVTLGPEESITTEVFSWDRTVSEREEDRETEFEATAEQEVSSTLTMEIETETNTSLSAGVGGDVGASLPTESVNVDGGISGDVRSEMQTSVDMTMEQINEATRKSSEKLKQRHQVKTRSRREVGSETRLTRFFKNPNLGRTLHLHHFEVIARYRVETRVDGPHRFAVLVDNGMLGPFERDWVRAHHHFLDEVLLHDAYREGLAAAQVLAAQQWIDELAAAEREAREEQAQRIGGASDDSPVANAPIPDKGIYATAKRLREALSAFLSLGDIAGAIHAIEDHLDPFATISVAALAEAESLVSRTAWWTQFNLAYPGIPEQAQAFVDAYEEAFANGGQAGMDGIVSAVGGLVERLDDDWLTALKVFGTGVILAQLSMPASMANPIIYAYVMKLLYMPNDMGVMKLLSKARSQYAQFDARHTAETVAPMPPQAEKVVPTDLVPAPPRAYSEKELAEAHAALGRLLLHLERHATHYTNEYYKREEPAQRMHRLTEMGIGAFVENRILGFSGTSAMYPLRLGALSAPERDALARFMPEHRSLPAAEPFEITVPSGGITTEAVLGECEALEPYLIRRRELDILEREARLGMTSDSDSGAHTT
jgi:hypothetical protein